MRISDWTSDVCSSDLKVSYFLAGCYAVRRAAVETCGGYRPEMKYGEEELDLSYRLIAAGYDIVYEPGIVASHSPEPSAVKSAQQGGHRSEEHTSELQSLMRISYAVFCLKKKQIKHKK